MGPRECPGWTQQRHEIELSWKRIVTFAGTIQTVMVTQRWRNSHVTKKTLHLWVWNSVNAWKRIEPVRMRMMRTGLNAHSIQFQVRMGLKEGCPCKRIKKTMRIQFTGYNTMNVLGKEQQTKCLNMETVCLPPMSHFAPRWRGVLGLQSRSWSDDSHEYILPMLSKSQRPRKCYKKQWHEVHSMAKQLHSLQTQSIVALKGQAWSPEYKGHHSHHHKPLKDSSAGTFDTLVHCTLACANVMGVICDEITFHKYTFHEIFLIKIKRIMVQV